MRFSASDIRLLAIGAAVMALLSLLVIARDSFSVPAESSKPVLSPPGRKVSKELSNRPADVVLAHEIDRTIDESELTQARWGVFVMSLNDGRIVYSRNGDKLFTPASNMKIYTTAVALDLLGADYRWRTSVYADKQPDQNGVIEGDLTLYGRGAPDLLSFRKGSAPSLADLADQLYQRGVRRVRGNVIGDDSYFRGNAYGDGWQWTDLQWYFGAEPSALTVDANAFELTITPSAKTKTPATLEIKPNSSYLHLKNNTTTAERSAVSTIGINRGLSDNEVQVWGEFPFGGRGFTAYMSVYNPALWAATLFKDALGSRGIKIDGEARYRDFRAAENETFNPEQASELAQVQSETLGEAVRSTNKESINLNAELILRTLGKERGAIAPAADPHKTKQRGDDEAGIAVIKLWLERAGIPSAGIEIRDGSGLSRLDLTSPEVTTRLLAAIVKTNSYQVFHDSLPIAGRDGTLGARLRSKSGRLVAKTGTLTFDYSLSGYATSSDNEVLAFSILCNDATGRSNALKVIDQIASLLVSPTGK